MMAVMRFLRITQAIDRNEKYAPDRGPQVMTMIFMGA